MSESNPENQDTPKINSTSGGDLGLQTCSPTPETDRIYNVNWDDGTSETLAALMIDHAKKMEVERDEARREAKSHRYNAISVMMGCGGTFALATPFSWENV